MALTISVTTVAALIVCGVVHSVVRLITSERCSWCGSCHTRRAKHLDCGARLLPAYQCSRCQHSWYRPHGHSKKFSDLCD